MADCVNDPVIDDTTILTLATAPASVSSDGTTVTERSAADLIVIDKYFRGRKSACQNGGWGGIQVTRASLPDTRGNV
jgi:hypothetical protein